MVRSDSRTAAADGSIPTVDTRSDEPTAGTSYAFKVARALAVVGDTEHADVLRRLLNDPDPVVAAAADRALPRLTERLGL